MSVNALDFNQAATLLSNILYYAQGQPGTAPVVPATEREFVSVGTTALLTGYDKLATAVSQVLSETIFSVRPYSRKFDDLNVSEKRYGAITRKLAVVDKPFENDQKFDLVDGQSVDHYEVKKPLVLQINYYGANEFQDHITIYTEQLNAAMTGSEQFGQFITMIMQNMSDKIEQAHEGLARMALNNLIAGSHYMANTTGVSDTAKQVKLVTEFNAFTGGSATWAQIKANPQTLNTFIRFAKSRLDAYSELMTNRSALYHQNITGKTLMKHTPKADQRFYMISDFLGMIDAMTLSTTFNDEYVKIDAKPVDFWYDINNPYAVDDSQFTILKKDGTLDTISNYTISGDVCAVIFDRDACGYSTIKHTTATTPLNAAGLFYNQYYHFTDQYWNSFEENCLVFTLD